ncbi:MAG: TetR/AcrR family transcriptional regulator [Novosphingobium sp.]|nr:TetR/AcrR family transcriptional regulator [Novosphingobium sp.]
MTVQGQAGGASLTAGKVGRPRRTVTEKLDESLLQLAVQALRDADFTEISLSGLAKRIGVSKPTLYRRFGSKNGLVAAMVEYEFARMLDVSSGNREPRADPMGNLRAYARDLFEFFIRPSTANFVRFQNQEGVDSPQLAALRKSVHLGVLANLADLIRRVQESQNDQNADPNMLAALLVSVLQSPASLFSLGFDLDEALRGLTPDGFFEWRFQAFLNAMNGLAATDDRTKEV